ncbi:hypothetical protein [Arthrobacter sp. efr-133-TYG-104]|uniref:hypothetical protein n=1 Tax=Arthrobacter sp. efr-133-TYG-104 TaxID=3040324 RepID=UPI00254CFE40|nr:hypothetical protein [Arthrobacter sp. efr-133-TYG-104]
MPGPAKSQRFDASSLIPSALLGVIAYVTLYVVACAFLVLAIVGLAISQGGNTNVPASSMLPQGSTPSPWSIMVQLAAQLVVMSQLGALGTTIDVTVPFLGNVHGTAGLFATPLLLTALSIAVLFVGGRFVAKRKPAPTTAGMWLESAATGLVFTLLVNVIGAITGISFPIPQLKVAPLVAVTIGSVLAAFVVGTFASLAGRTWHQGRPSGVRAIIRDAGAAIGVHFGVFLVVAVPVAVTAMGIKFGWQATFSAPLWALTAGFFLLGLGHLSPIIRTWNFSTSASSSVNSSGSETGFGPGTGLTQFDIPGWAGWLLLLLALVALVATSIFWYLRRGPADTKKVTDWVVLPGAFLAAGTLLTWLSSLTGSFEAGTLVTGTGSVALAGWTAFVMLLWGAATEASARFLAPILSNYIPARAAERLRTRRPVQDDPNPQQSQPGHPGTASYADPYAQNSHTTAVAPRERISPGAKRKLGLVLGGIGLVVVLLVAGAITVNVIKDGNGPDKPVKDYLQALQNGEASKAIALSDPNVANDQRALLTDEVYSKAGKRIDGFDIVSTQTSGDGAKVVAELRQDGRKQQTTYTLRKSNPELLDDHWKMDAAPIGQLTISADSMVQTVLVNGHELNLGLGGGTSSSTGVHLPALPGEYTVQLPASEKYLTAAKSTALVTVVEGAQAPPGVQLKVEASDALKTEALAQVNAHITECLKSTDAEPANCPFSIYASSYARNFHWSLTTKPTLSLTKNLFDASGWSIQTDNAGKATVSYEKDSSYGFGAPDWKPATETSSFYVNASVTIKDGKVQTTFSKY